MRAKNAFFNIERLGAICRRYYADYYGPVASRLQQGLPSDRLIAEWWIRSRRVTQALAGKPSRRAAEPARAMQGEVRRKLTALFRRKMVIISFVRKKREGHYQLRRMKNSKGLSF